MHGDSDLDDGAGANPSGPRSSGRHSQRRLFSLRQRLQLRVVLFGPEPNAAESRTEAVAEFRQLVLDARRYFWIDRARHEAVLFHLPTYSATKAAIHAFSDALRYQLRETSVDVIEIVPPYVQTELMGEEQANDPNAMPLAEFIDEVMSILETQPGAREVLVKRVHPLRFAAEQGYEKYMEQFHTFNDRFGAGHVG